MATMKALQCLQSEGRLEVHDVPYPTITRPDDVMVRVAYAGVCGTDLHALAGEYAMAQTWMTLGHEFSGVVAEVGSSVTSCKVGDRVVVDPNMGCGICRSCKSASAHLCMDGGANTTLGFWRQGGWAEATVAPESCVHLIPDSLPLPAACLCEPLSCLIHGLDRVEPLALHGRTLVLGAGIIGILSACIFHHRGLREVIVSEPSPARRAFVDQLKLGFKTVTPAEAEQLFGDKSSRQLDKEGLDLVFDCSGCCPAVEKAATWLRQSGTLCLFGVPPPSAKISISPYLMVSRELTIKGTVINPFTFPRAVCLASDLKTQYLDLEKLGCEVFTLDQHETAINMLKRGEISKAVFALNTDL